MVVDICPGHLQAENYVLVQPNATTRKVRQATSKHLLQITFVRKHYKIIKNYFCILLNEISVLRVTHD